MAGTAQVHDVDIRLDPLTPRGHHRLVEGRMSDVKVRNLDEAVVAGLRRQAAAAGRSLEEELRRILTEEHRRRRQAVADEVVARQEALHRRWGELPDSTPGIREDRDRRG